MFLINKILILFLLVFFVGSGTVSAQGGLDFETITQGADLSDAMVTSGQGSLLFEYVRVDSLSSKAKEDDQEFISQLSPGEEAVIHNQEIIEMLFNFDDPKMRCDENSMNRLPTGRWYSQNWQWAYNGEKMDLLRLDGLGQEDLIIPMGSIRAGNVIPVHRFDPRYNGMKILGTTVGTFLHGTFGDRTVKDLRIIGEEVQDDIECNVIRGNIAETGDTITVWLAPSLLYRAKHVELKSSDGKIVIHNSFKEYDSGMWFPEKIIKEVYYINDRTGDEVLYQRETLNVQNDFKLNIDLPANLFEIDFPVGLIVYDYRTGEEFEVK